MNLNHFFYIPFYLYRILQCNPELQVNLSPQLWDYWSTNKATLNSRLAKAVCKGKDWSRET